MNKLIDLHSPCPMSLKSIENNSFQCKSCNKQILDLRNKSPEEIRREFKGTNICGIFNENQIQKRTFSFSYRLRFTLLTIIAYFGFNVKPIIAQSELKHETQNEHTFTVSPEKPKQTEAQNEEKKQKRKNFFRARKNKKVKQFRFTGCPSF